MRYCRGLLLSVLGLYVMGRFSLCEENFCRQTKDDRIVLKQNWCNITCHINGVISDSTIHQYLEKLHRETEEEQRIIFHDFFEGDISSVSNFSKRNIPIIHRRRPFQCESVWVKAYDVLTEISIYRQLGQEKYAIEHDLQVDWSNRTTHKLLCSFQNRLQAEAPIQTIPSHVCHKRLTLLRLPNSSSEFAKWLYVVLQDNVNNFIALRRTLN